jgi:mono/diheme cytochrome c family protein
LERSQVLARRCADCHSPRGLLGAFRNQVDAKIDKGLTAAQAAELKLLSTRV